MIVGKPNFSDTHLFMSLICSTRDFNLITFIMRCYDKGKFVGIDVAHLGASIVGSGYGPHYISDTKKFSGFIFIAVKQRGINTYIALIVV